MPKPKRVSLKSNRGKTAVNIKMKKAKLAFYLNKGLSLEDACILAKINKVQLGTLRTDLDFEEFIQACQLRYRDGLEQHLVDAAEIGSWKAAAWLLERKFPEKYGKKDFVKHDYDLKIQTFMKVVLESINNASPQLKHEIIKKLRSIDMKMITDGNDNVVDAEII